MKEGILTPLTGTFATVLTITNETWKPDFANAEKALHDILQEGGVIKNDRSIRFFYVDGLPPDKENPSAEITLYRIPEQIDLFENHVLQALERQKNLIG